jgi:hypothetical protein
MKVEPETKNQNTIATFALKVFHSKSGFNSGDSHYERSKVRAQPS